VVAKFIGLAMRGETLEVNRDGTQTRDFIYIDDLIRAPSASPPRLKASAVAAL
jgi:nucleoside-diphosphate-sugar epimerase